MFNKTVNINHTINLLPLFHIQCTCIIMCTNFGKKRTTFAETTLKNRVDPNSRTRARGRSTKGQGGGQWTIISSPNSVLLFYMLISACVQSFARKRSHLQKLHSNPWNIRTAEEHMPRNTCKISRQQRGMFNKS